MKLLLFCLLIFVESTYAADCDGTFTSIAVIQGQQDKSPLLNQKVVVKAVVTGVFTETGGLDGFFVQSMQPDNDLNTSEGLFIYTGRWQPDVTQGDVVAISGRVSELHDLTQLQAIEGITLCESQHNLPEPKNIQLPLDDFNLENVENMRVTVTGAIITDIYQYLKFGELTVSSERMFSTTTLVEPGLAVPPLMAFQQRDQLVIDDGRLQAYARPFSVGEDGQASVAADNPIRTGYMLDAVGVLNYAFGQYKLQPTQALKISPQSNFREQQPDRPNGNLTVATFNIENWFTDFNDGSDQCGNIKGMGCRGARNELEQRRQLAKLVTVINRLDAAAIGLQELQNNQNESLQRLVEALNETAEFNKWAYINAGQLGQDVIKVGIIYQPQLVEPQGEYALLNSESLPEYEDHRNRVVLAQTFQHNNSQQLFTLASLHLKSKGCRDAVGLDMAQKDGQGCYNPTRSKAAQQIVNWLDTDPTNMGAELRLVVGDFNSYQKEDPIVVFEKAGYVNLAQEFLGVENWTTSYRGKVGSLDYIMVNKALAEKASGVTQWHINADEIRDFGYRISPLAEGIARPVSFYQASPFSSSDHDPVIAGFELSLKPVPSNKK
ncbi:ExeM/NucH family extracellular endonuclease [Marinicella gelatinilytica]|uniref:ExeM/NucH family extracellular endonuclease n=1 Tax=Marinicella gelatinilytica TaxID=2996017 RepID=UPI002260E390|nr:ExeM/NucH family extracellular endonuclease [Marinicella gelatinilytica]MCX7543789.1 ExeM/NucH family extracellular endonuclease [Marinicella gelatinilytica]